MSDITPQNDRELKPHAAKFPQRLTLELTNACNLRCTMCPSRWEPTLARGLMEPELFRRIVDEAAEHLPVAVVPFFRGESLLHPRAAELIGYAKKRGLGPVQLASNAQLLDEATARALLEAGLDFLSFSLDSDDPVEYAAIRVGGQLALAKTNVLRFLELRDRGGYATQIQVSATRTADNAGSIERFKAFWGGRADRTRVYYEHSADGHTGSLACDEVPAEMARRPCLKLWEDLVVYYDGGVGLCNHDWYRGLALADLTKASIAQVWNSPAYVDLREEHLAPETMADETCLHCDHWKMYYLERPFIGELIERGAEGAEG